MIIRRIRILWNISIESEDQNRRLLQIVKRVGGSIYLSGNGAKSYLDRAVFENNNVTVEFSDFVPSVYNQQFGEFVSGLSVLDILSNCGVNGYTTLKGASRDVSVS